MIFAKMTNYVSAMALIVFFFSAQVFAAIEVESTLLTKLQTTTGTNYAVEPTKDYVLMYFWATWCPDCKVKLKGPLKEAINLKNTSLVVVNTEKDKNMVSNFMERENIKLPVFMDLEKEVRKSLKVFSVPQWVLLKKNENKFELIATEVEFDLQKIKTLVGKN